MRKLSLKPPERTAALQAAWDDQGPAELGPCGEFWVFFPHSVELVSSLVPVYKVLKVFCL